MSLEQFLYYRAPSNKKILHAPSVDLEWNLKNAHDLMDNVCNILPVLAKNKRYAVLSKFLENKETYLELFNELGDLMDKHNFDKHVGRYTDLEDTDEPYGDQTDLHFDQVLRYADMLVARDQGWRSVFTYDDEY